MMNVKRYVYVACILMGVVSLTTAMIFWPNFSIALGVLLGGSTALLGLWSLIRAVDNVPLRDLKQIKRGLLMNKLMRYGIYASAIILSLSLPFIFDKVATISALLVIKLLLVVTEMTYRKRTTE